MSDGQVPSNDSEQLVEQVWAVLAERDKLRKVADAARWMSHDKACSLTNGECYCGFDELQALVDEALGPDEASKEVRRWERHPTEAWADGKLPKPIRDHYVRILLGPAGEEQLWPELARLEVVLAAARKVCIAHGWASADNFEDMYWLSRTVDELVAEIRAVDVSKNEDPDDYLNTAGPPPPRPEL